MNDKSTKNTTESDLLIKQQKPQEAQTQETQKNKVNKSKLTTSDKSK